MTASPLGLFVAPVTTPDPERGPVEIVDRPAPPHYVAVSKEVCPERTPLPMYLPDTCSFFTAPDHRYMWLSPVMVGWMATRSPSSCIVWVS